MARKPGSLGRALRINYETIYGLPKTVDLWTAALLLG